MTAEAKKQTWIIEEDAMCILDIDPVDYPSHRRVKYHDGWYHINPEDFFGWMYETNRIDHHENGVIISKGYTYQPDKFWSENTVTGALDQDLIEYRKSGAAMTAEDGDWLSDIRTPEPAQELKPEKFTPEQEAALAEWYGLDYFTR